MPDENAKAEPKPKPKKKKAPGRNRLIEGYPQPVLQALDRCILSGDGAKKCLDYLVFNHPSIPAPAYPTMFKYVKAREQQLMTNTELRLKIEYSLRDLDMMQVNSKDPSEMVSALFDLFSQRIEAVKKLSNRTGGAHYEKILVELGNSMAKLMETQMKLEQHGKMMEGRLQVMLDVLVKHLIPVVKQVYGKVHGDKKMKEFSEALDDAVKATNWESVEVELAEALASVKKGGPSGQA